jgi:amidase
VSGTAGAGSPALHSLDALEVADRLAAGSLTSVALVEHLLGRIRALEPRLHAVIALADDALAQAAASDARRGAGAALGPLDGVPVLVKDNIEVLGLPASAGSLAMADSPAQRDAPLVARLRAGGLVVLGSTNLSEWANFRGVGSASGWSALGGLVDNPWMAGRSAGGSSSGSGAALAAGYAPLAIGTETDGSITCPAALCGVVGLKPTVGLLPTGGIVPIAGSQDVPGPLGRSVADVAALFAVLSGAADPAAPAHPAGAAPRRFVLGAPAAWRTGDAGADAVLDAALAGLRDAGMAVVELEGVAEDDEVGIDEVTVLVHEMADDLDAYLRARPGTGPTSVAAVVAFNAAHADVELAHYGQEYLERAVACTGRADPQYAAARARNLDWAIGTVLAPAFAHGVDVLVAPAYGPAWESRLAGGDVFAGGAVTTAPAIAGWPILTVPIGLAEGLPIGLAIVGPAHGEATLLAVGAAVEAALGRLGLAPLD